MSAGLLISRRLQPAAPAILLLMAAQLAGALAEVRPAPGAVTVPLHAASTPERS